MISSTHWAIGALGIAVILALRFLFGWREGEWVVVCTLLGLWVAAVAALAGGKRWSTHDLLFLLDRKGGWKDRFSSAWEFAEKEVRSPAETRHLEMSSPMIGSALDELPDQIPARSLAKAWIGPFLAIVLAFTPIWRPVLAPGERELTDEMKAAAKEQSEALMAEAARAKDLSALTEEEKEDLEKILASVEGAAETLADPEGLTSGEMLEALEARARAAERLAEQLGLSDDGWASEAFIAEMEKYPDTADLALSIREKEAESAAEEATKLYELLDESELARETAERVSDTLERVMTEAQEEDHAKPVGERVGNASRKMLDQQVRTAAREFFELARHFRLLEQREDARERLEQLADSVRESGSEISGSELQQMESLARESRGDQGESGGLQPLDPSSFPEDLQNMLSPQMAQAPRPGNQTPNTGGDSPRGDAPEMKAPIPGEPSPEGGAGQGGESALQAPIPGEQPSGDSSGQGMAMSDEAQQGEGEGGLLSAPIPGMESDDSQAGSAGMAQSGGSGANGQGGNQAGSGTAELVENQSERLSAANDSEVVAQINEDGESSVRAVEGGVRREEATRSRQEIVRDFLAAEEQALDGQSIPQSRKDHIIRYFSGIRKQFEEAADSSGSQ